MRHTSIKPLWFMRHKRANPLWFFFCVRSTATTNWKEVHGRPLPCSSITTLIHPVRWHLRRYMYKWGYQVRATTRAYTIGTTKPPPPTFFPWNGDQYNWTNGSTACKMQCCNTGSVQARLVEEYPPLDWNQCSSTARNGLYGNNCLATYSKSLCYLIFFF